MALGACLGWVGGARGQWLLGPVGWVESVYKRGLIDEGQGQVIGAFAPYKDLCKEGLA